MKISDLSNAERETNLNMVADDRGFWTMYTDDPVMIAKMKRLDIEPVAGKEGHGQFYQIPANQVSIRRPPRKLTKEEREAAGRRLAAARSQTTAK